MVTLARILLAFCCSLTAFGQSANETARQIAVRSFYATVLTFRESGIPSRAEIRRLKPLVSRNLLSLLEKAWKAESLYARRTKGVVPPLVESRLFFSLFEGASRLQAVMPESSGTCLVELVYDDDQNPVLWNDLVFLVRVGSRWVVDDIAFRGEWAFMDKGRLQDTLRTVIQVANETPQD